MAKRSKYQENVIRGYYRQRENIALQRVQELVSELYLSQGKARQRQWKHVSTHLAALGVRQEQIEHLVRKDNPELVAHLIRSLIQER